MFCGHVDAHHDRRAFWVLGDRSDRARTIFALVGRNELSETAADRTVRESGPALLAAG
jgi:hypothetical protein